MAARDRAPAEPVRLHAIYAPDGINLAWATTVPGLALPFAPVTILFGPVVAYNLAALLMPALGAWTAYLLCRYLTGSLWASVVGGYLFGFSAYMLGQQLAHLHMTAVFLLPLSRSPSCASSVRSSTGGGLAWRLGVLLGLQFWLSTELFFTAVLALGVALLLAFGLVREPSGGDCGRSCARRSRVSAIAALVAGPLGVYAVTGLQSDSINDPRPSTATCSTSSSRRTSSGRRRAASRHISPTSAASDAEPAPTSACRRC